jgi:hypothetical protein
MGMMHAASCVTIESSASSYRDADYKVVSSFLVDEDEEKKEDHFSVLSKDSRNIEGTDDHTWALLFDQQDTFYDSRPSIHRAIVSSPSVNMFCSAEPYVFDPLPCVRSTLIAQEDDNFASKNPPESGHDGHYTHEQQHQHSGLIDLLVEEMCGVNDILSLLDTTSDAGCIIDVV